MAIVVYIVIALVVTDIIFRERPVEFDKTHAFLISVGLGILWPITILILLGLQIHEVVTWLLRRK